MTQTADCVADVACDYLTVTGKDTPRTAELHSYASSLFRYQADIGNTVCAWGMKGYKGWKCGSVQIGEREGDLIVRLSSDSASRSWRKAVELCGKVTRMDIQCTVLPACGPSERIDEDRHAAESFAEECKPKPIVRWIQDNRKGYTLYLGSRESNVFGRIYDKHAQTGLAHHKGAVRYEVQFNSRLANAVACTLQRTSSPIPTMIGYCSQFFEGRGVSWRIPNNAQARYSCSRPASNDEKCLAWLASAVSPSVRRLIANGKGAECLRALGLVVENSQEVDHVVQDSTD